MNPAKKLKTNRRLWKLIVFGIITLGIYNIVAFEEMSGSLNLIASRYDGRKTMSFCLLFFLVSWATCGIGYLVWFHRISNRVGDELQRRGSARTISASTWWLWSVLGSFIIVGPFVYEHKLTKAMNLLSEDYNQRG